MPRQMFSLESQPFRGSERRDTSLPSKRWRLASLNGPSSDGQVRRASRSSDPGHGRKPGHGRHSGASIAAALSPSSLEAVRLFSFSSAIPFGGRPFG